MKTVESDIRRDRPPDGAQEADDPHPSGGERPGRAGPAGGTEGGDAFAEAMAQQTERRTQLRYVREFLNSPQFVDLRSAPVTTSSDPDEIAQRRRDLAYRITVLDALRTLLAEELAAIERMTAASPETDDDPS